jgi:hypothetical protein
MKTYTTVEDYLEVIAGIRDPVTLKTKSSNWFNDFEPIVSLARYDTDVLNSMSTTANEGRALTEKQGELAVKIVLKYQRQLAAKGIDVAPVEQPVWRMPLRVMDYTRQISIQNDKIVVQFPFNNELIEELRTFRKESQGRGEWLKDTKQWHYALTEYNLVWLTTWAQHREFKFDQEVTRLNQMIAETEMRPYAIELCQQDDQITITNCPSTLHDYIVDHVGGFSQDNLPRLIDMSSVLGYTVSKTIADSLVASAGPRLYNLLVNREVKLNPMSAEQDLASVLDYADATQRWPVVIYEPDQSMRLFNCLTALRNDVVRVATKRDIKPGIETAKYIHTVVPTSFSVPLLISSAGMIYGGDKSLMVQNAEKIVYCSAEVYNKAGHTKVQPIAS